MITAIIVAALGVCGIVLGGLQLSGRLPLGRRVGPLPSYGAYLNIVSGLFFMGLAALRLGGLL